MATKFLTADDVNVGIITIEGHPEFVWDVGDSFKYIKYKHGEEKVKTTVKDFRGIHFCTSSYDFIIRNMSDIVKADKYMIETGSCWGGEMSFGSYEKNIADAIRKTLLPVVNRDIRFINSHGHALDDDSEFGTEALFVIQVFRDIYWAGMAGMSEPPPATRTLESLRSSEPPFDLSESGLNSRRNFVFERHSMNPETFERNVEGEFFTLYGIKEGIRYPMAQLYNNALFIESDLTHLRVGGEVKLLHIIFKGAVELIKQRKDIYVDMAIDYNELLNPMPSELYKAIVHENIVSLSNSKESTGEKIVQANKAIDENRPIFKETVKKLKDMEKNKEAFEQEMESEFNAIRADKRVSSLKLFKQDKELILEIRTHSLIMTNSKEDSLYELGKMKIVINLTSQFLSFFNESPEVMDIVRGNSGWGMPRQAPHVGETGKPCLGSWKRHIAEMLDDGDFVTLFDYIMFYLEDPNMDDNWGEQMVYWPRYSKAAKKLSLPEKPSFVPRLTLGTFNEHFEASGFSIKELSDKTGISTGILYSIRRVGSRQSLVGDLRDKLEVAFFGKILKEEIIEPEVHTDYFFATDWLSKKETTEPVSRTVELADIDDVPRPTLYGTPRPLGARRLTATEVAAGMTVGERLAGLEAAPAPTE